jgi:hypothetical protein
LAARREKNFVRREVWKRDQPSVVSLENLSVEQMDILSVDCSAETMGGQKAVPSVAWWTEKKDEKLVV